MIKLALLSVSDFLCILHMLEFVSVNTLYKYVMNAVFEIYLHSLHVCLIYTIYSDDHATETTSKQNDVRFSSIKTGYLFFEGKK